ncbi:MAG: hypothetical protein M1814_004972 [Vezdaea aestivalis]|nr:MAG: hypothetical protein M1814_004972 [Vezdaea aestivalis]
MGGKKAAGENSKKAQGNARKADAAAVKQAAEGQKRAKIEDEEWDKGAKSSAKKDAAEQKKADAARKKAEKDALLKDEEASLPSAKKGVSKPAVKKSKGLDLSALDSPAPTSSAPALNATNIDDALSALTLTSASSGPVDRHPERRFAAAFKKFKDARVEELKSEQPGLRGKQRDELAYKEFKAHPDNPFNMVSAKFDSSKEEVRDIKEAEREGVERRLAEK